MNELEEKMASILDEIGVKYISQFEIGTKYPEGCNSKYPCRYKDEDFVNPCQLARDEECEWRQNYVPLYILDFAINIYGKNICIECDGYKWHFNRENEDAIRDKYLKDNGWIVKRYAGTIITSHRSKVKKELSELFDSLKPKLQRGLF